MSISEPVASTTIVSPRAIGPYSATVTIEEVSTDNLEITQHPVQDGAAITDHAFMQPAELSLRVGFSADDSPLDVIYKNLLELQASRAPMDVITGKRAYSNMLIKSLGVTTDANTENILSVNFTLQEIIIATVATVKIPPRAKQKTPAKTAQTENAGQKAPRPKSIALGAYGGAGYVRTGL